MKLDAIIVEDSLDNLEVLQHFIKKYCPQLKITGTAATIEEADKLIRLQKPDLVFLDIVLDGRKSFELLEQLESESGINFMIIFVTAHSRFDFAEKVIDYSAIWYLTKPVDKDKLKFAVSKAA
ncbi:MAG: response regulator [Saprospirales bacterium]|nr:MAG: response regulator [Saprospirales bacterium]